MCCEIHPFVLAPQREASFERTAIAWLLKTSDLELADALKSEPALRDYMRCQVSNWAMLSGENQLGALERGEFIEKFLPFSRKATLPQRFQEVENWFELIDQEDAGAVTLDAILDFIIRSEKLLQTVIQSSLFAGTIAGGASAFKLTVADPDPRSTLDVQLYTAPLGNMVPVGNLFQLGKAVAPVQIQEWQHRIRMALEAGKWPSGRRGVFVGISSMYHAAKAAGIDQRLVSRGQALAALKLALAQELTDGSGSNHGNGNKTHQQIVANMIIVVTVIEHVMHEDAWLYFRRAWNVCCDTECNVKNTAVATWSLGWFLSCKLNQKSHSGGAMRCPSNISSSNLARISTISEDRFGNRSQPTRTKTKTGTKLWQRFCWCASRFQRASAKRSSQL